MRLHRSALNDVGISKSHNHLVFVFHNVFTTAKKCYFVGMPIYDLYLVDAQSHDLRVSDINLLAIAALRRHQSRSRANNPG